ncbi:MAG: DUF928 domain-containing protein [Cyanobacteria bacterium]|jgi:hypothetical protein|nr:DUF928 domain-containing protein [Cyanobacteria bacterium GSL.Bin21]
MIWNWFLIGFLSVNASNIESPPSLELVPKLESGSDEPEEQSEKNNQSLDQNPPNSSDLYEPSSMIREDGKVQDVDIQGTRRGDCSVRYPRLLVPNDHWVRAVRPSLLLAFPNALSQDVVVLLTSDKGDLIYEQRLKVDQSGIIAIAPEHRVKEGSYFWTVVIACDSRLALNPYARIKFEVVSLSQRNESILTEEIRWLAQNGIWFDAILKAYDDYTAGYPRLFETLLKNAGLEQEINF